jgi:hypothetical protein
MNDYIWTPTGTDITIRWRQAGWVPPSELPEYQEKWKHYQELPMRKLDDNGKKQYEALLLRNKVARIK